MGLQNAPRIFFSVSKKGITQLKGVIVQFSVRCCQTAFKEVVPVYSPTSSAPPDLSPTQLFLIVNQSTRYNKMVSQGFSFAFPLLIWCGIFSYAYWLNCFSSFKIPVQTFCPFFCYVVFHLDCEVLLFWMVVFHALLQIVLPVCLLFSWSWWLEIALIAKLTVFYGYSLCLV